MDQNINDLKLYQIPIDLIPISVVVYKKDGEDFIFVDFNKAAETTEDIKKEVVVGKSLTDVFPGVKDFGLIEVLERVHESGKSETFNLEFYKDERISGWRKNEIIKLPNGDIMAMYEDLTKAKETEQRLQLLGKVIDSSINEIYMFDSETLKFTYLNRGAQENLGHTLEEMQEMTPVDIKQEYTKQQFTRALAPLLDGSKSEIILDTTHHRKDNTFYNVEAHIQLIKVNDCKQFVVIGLDTTDRKKTELSLKESEEKFRTIAENSLMGIFIYTDKFNYVNKALVDTVGYSENEIYNMSPLELFEESLQENIKDIMAKRLSGEKFPQQYHDLKLVSKCGQTKITRVMTETIKYKGGYAGLGTVVNITDITETKKKLKMLAQAVEQTDEMVMITDEEGIITYINDAYIAQTGYKHSELIGKKANLFSSGKHDNAFYQELWDTINSGKTYSNTLINKKKDTQLYYEEKTITPIFDENDVIQNFVSTGRDITSRINMEKELHERATLDSLTGIFNRHSGNELINLEINKAHRYKNTFAVLMLDIDHFKKINDTYGHDVGDNILEEFTKLISLHIRKSDAFIRWGGEEFIILSPNINKQESISFAEKLRVDVASYKFVKGINISASIGVTIFKDGDTKESILKRADLALYEAKTSGRNNIKYN